MGRTLMIWQIRLVWGTDMIAVSRSGRAILRGVDAEPYEPGGRAHVNFLSGPVYPLGHFELGFPQGSLICLNA